MSAYTGTVEIEIAGEKHQLKYDWHALAELASKFGTDSIGNPYELSTDKIAEIISVGTGGKLTVKAIMDASPPLHPTIKIVDHAIAIAYFGPEGVQKIEDAIVGNKKKKTE